MSASASAQCKQKKKGGPRASGDGRRDDRARTFSSSTCPSRFPLLLSLSLLLLVPLSSLMLASAQQQQQPQIDPAVIEAIGAATLAGESDADGAAFSSPNFANSSDPDAAADPAAAGAVLTEAERQARLDRVLGFLSAGNIFVGNYQPYQRVIRRRVEEWVECRLQSRR